MTNPYSDRDQIRYRATPAERDIQILVERMLDRDPSLTRAEAITRVCQRHPGLYESARDESLDRERLALAPYSVDAPFAPEPETGPPPVAKPPVEKPAQYTARPVAKPAPKRQMIEPKAITTYAGPTTDGPHVSAEVATRCGHLIRLADTTPLT